MKLIQKYFNISTNQFDKIKNNKKNWLLKVFEIKKCVNENAIKLIQN